jgi:hypothetical protein
VTTQTVLDFLNWYFNTHWLIATFATPGLTMLYASFTDQTTWAIWTGVLWFMTLVGKGYNKK